MWTHFLRLGSLALICTILSGCNTSRTEWVVFGDWVYQNNSTYKLEIKGAINNFTTNNPPMENFILIPENSYKFEFVFDSGKHTDHKEVISPFDTLPYLPNRVVQIIIDEKQTITIEKDTGIRNRNNYKVESLGKRHFRFTYTFTDKMIGELIRTAK